MNEMEAKFESATKDKRLLQEDAENKKQKSLVRLATAIALAIAIIAVVVFRALRVTRRQKFIIEKQKLMAEQHRALVEEKQKEILDSIRYAKRIQSTLLASADALQKYLPEHFVFFKPKDIVSGDFYWLAHPEPLVGGAILIAACDCTGHGVPGAMVSVVCSNALNRAVKEFNLSDPGKVLDKTRELVLEAFSQRDSAGVISGSEIQDGMDISLCTIRPSAPEGGRYDWQIEWSGAYNPLWYIQNGEFLELEADKQPIGKSDNPKPFITHTISINRQSGEGVVLYLFTDGFADQFGGAKGKKYKYKQLQELLLANCKKPLAEQKVILEEEFERWKGGLEQTDDVCVIGIKI